MRRKSKSRYVLFIIIAMLSVSIGYAILNSTLIINGTSNVHKSTWEVVFRNISIKDGSVEAINVPTITDNTKVNFDISLAKPGDFYQFTVDVINNGTMDVMIESIVKNPELTESQKKYLNYIIEYETGVQVNTKQVIKSTEFLRIKVRVEYKKDISVDDLPIENELLNLGFNVNYVQSDGKGSIVKDNGANKAAIADGDLDVIGTIVTIGTEKFYTIGTDGDDVKLLAMHNLYVGGYYDGTTLIPYGDEATGMQDERMTGRGQTNSARHGVTGFSTYNSGNSNLKYSGSIVEGYVLNYKNELENRFGVDVVEARLITTGELYSKEIGCGGQNCTYSRYEWIYSTSYYTQTVDSFYRPYGVYQFGALLYNGGYTDFGVRPVIVLSRDDITAPNSLTIFTSGDVTTLGTIVRIESEMFYSIGLNSSNNVELLGMYNLKVGNIVDANGNVTPINAKNVKQHSSALGYTTAGYPHVGTIEYSNATFSGTNASTYKGSLVEYYMKEYKKMFDEEFGVIVKSSRFPNMNDVMSQYLGSSSFLYSTSCWLGHTASDTTLMTLKVGSSYAAASYDINNIYGIRPIIAVSQDYFS